MAFSSAFIAGFNYTMKYEVGEWFNPNDPETIKGLCSTKEQCRKTGYVNNKNDSGGETKFGIAKVHNPDVNIITLTLADAMEIYYNKYWLMGHCDKIPGELACLMFDCNVHHGSKRATEFLQRAVGAEDDGSFGAMTLAAINKSTNLQQDMVDMLNEREAFMRRNVKAVPKNAEFLNGWINRVNGLRKLFKV